MRTAVVGHVEWVRFAAVERLPKPGEIIHARESWLEPAGGGAVAAAELLRLAGNCDFFVAVGQRRDRAGGSRRARGARSPRPRGCARRAPAPRVHLPRGRTASGRSRSSARSSTPTAATRCLGASWRRSTPCTSAPVTRMHCARHDGRAFSSPPRASCPRSPAPASSWTRSSTARPIRRRRTSRVRSSRSRSSSSRPEGAEGGTFTSRRPGGLVRRGRRFPGRSRTPTGRAIPSPPASAFALARGDGIERGARLRVQLGAPRR